jgi:hypothetical protein
MIHRDPAISGPLGCEKDELDKCASRCLQVLKQSICSRSLLSVAGIRCKSVIEGGFPKKESGKRLQEKA